METCQDCKFCFGKVKPCLLELTGIKTIRDNFCKNYLARNLYKWVHSRSIELLQNGFHIVGDDHDGTTHSFTFQRGNITRIIIYDTTKGHLSARIYDDIGKQLVTWTSHN